MIDFLIAQHLNKLFLGSIVDTVSKIISSYLFMAFIFGSIILLIFFKDKKNRKKIIFIILIAIALHFLISEFLIKDTIGSYISRERPYIAHPNEIIPLGNLKTDSSFPSNHTSFTVAILTTIIFYYRKHWKYALSFAIIMGLSRIHNGMHYPSDIIGGFILGGLYGLLAVYIGESIWKKLKNPQQNLKKSKINKP